MSFRSCQNSDLVVRDLTVNGHVTFANPPTFDIADLSLNSLIIAEDASVGGDLSVAGKSTLHDICSNSITCNGNIYCDYSLVVDADASIHGSTTQTGWLTCGSGLTVNAGAEMKSTLAVDGVLTAKSNASVAGTFTATGATTLSSTLAVTGKSTIHDISMNNATVTGDLHVTGEIYGLANNSSNLEVHYYNLKGANSSDSGTLNLQHNTTNTDQYVVFPSVYYGFTGSSGTYDAKGSSGSIEPIVISNITASSFKWNLEKSTADNVNVYLVFLVVYGVSNCDFPKSYSS
jgi:cytoskeletal protein CcmA (bactofilin family)